MSPFPRLAGLSRVPRASRMPLGLHRNLQATTIPQSHRQICSIDLQVAAHLCSVAFTLGEAAVDLLVYHV